MHHYASLGVSMEETHICVVERDGSVVLETKARSTPEAIAAVLETAPACQKIVPETGHIAPMLFHRLAALDLPVIGIESRQADALGGRMFPTSQLLTSDLAGWRMVRPGGFRQVGDSMVESYGGSGLFWSADETFQHFVLTVGTPTRVSAHAPRFQAGVAEPKPAELRSAAT